VRTKQLQFPVRKKRERNRGAKENKIPVSQDRNNRAICSNSLSEKAELQVQETEMRERREN
jgi:hypothetical protein